MIERRREKRRKGDRGRLLYEGVTVRCEVTIYIHDGANIAAPSLGRMYCTRVTRVLMHYHEGRDASVRAEARSPFPFPFDENRRRRMRGLSEAPCI